MSDTPVVSAVSDAYRKLELEWLQDGGNSEFESWLVSKCQRLTANITTLEQRLAAVEAACEAMEAARQNIRGDYNYYCVFSPVWEALHAAGYGPTQPQPSNEGAELPEHLRDPMEVLERGQKVLKDWEGNTAKGFCHWPDCACPRSKNKKCWHDLPQRTPPQAT